MFLSATHWNCSVDFILALAVSSPYLAALFSPLASQLTPKEKREKRKERKETGKRKKFSIEGRWRKRPLLPCLQCCHTLRKVANPANFRPPLRILFWNLCSNCEFSKPRLRIFRKFYVVIANFDKNPCDFRLRPCGSTEWGPSEKPAIFHRGAGWPDT